MLFFLPTPSWLVHDIGTLLEGVQVEDSQEMNSIFLNLQIQFTSASQTALCASSCQPISLPRLQAVPLAHIAVLIPFSPHEELQVSIATRILAERQQQQPAPRHEVRFPPRPLGEAEAELFGGRPLPAIR